MKKIRRGKKRKENGKPESFKRVEDFLDSLDQLYQSRQNNSNPPYPVDPKTKRIELPQYIDRELIGLCEQGDKPKAVQHVTKLTGAGLRISKDYVDALLRK